MKLSTRNILKGKVVEVKEGMIMAKVRVDIGGGNVITAIITDDALKDLNAKVGDELAVLIKATSVMGPGIFVNFPAAGIRAALGK